MIYHVQARLREGMGAALLEKLSDGSIESQRPDGPELVASMQRATVRPDGLVEWSELCFCNPPLAHERATVLDHYFEGIVTEPIDTHRKYEGQAFMKHLAEAAAT